MKSLFVKWLDDQFEVLLVHWASVKPVRRTLKAVGFQPGVDFDLAYSSGNVYWSQLMPKSDGFRRWLMLNWEKLL